MKHDIVFLYNGAPLPAMLEMAAHAKQLGRRPLLVLLDRGDNRLIIDSSLTNYDIVRIPVAYTAVDAKRLFAVPAQLRKIRRLIRDKLEPGGTVITSSFDMLFVAWLATVFRDYDIRHQVRDLHALQLGNSLKCRIVRRIERYLLRKVSKVIVSSPRFASEYYEHLYSGEIILLENVPQSTVWKDFDHRPRVDGTFNIGYIGILRYRDALFRLIESVERLAKEGLPVRVSFAGGGSDANLAAVKSRITLDDVFSFSGPYEYSRDITRLYADVDLIYAVYDENNRNCQLAMPNKFYESILSGIPLLVAANTFVGEETLRFGIGEVVAVDDPDDLANLLRAAFDGDSWYSEARAKLESTSADSMYADYERALTRSVQ